MLPVIVFPPLHHQTYTHEATDGTLRAWDVTRGNEIAADGREPLLFSLEEQGVTVEKIAALYPDIDQAYAMTTDLSRPLLFIPFFGEVLLIDGFHRLWRAARTGIPVLPIYLLSEEEATSIQWLQLPPGHGLNWR